MDWSNVSSHAGTLKELLNVCTDSRLVEGYQSCTWRSFIHLERLQLVRSGVWTCVGMRASLEILQLPRLRVLELIGCTMVWCLLLTEIMIIEPLVLDPALMSTVGPVNIQFYKN